MQKHKKTQKNNTRKRTPKQNQKKNIHNSVFKALCLFNFLLQNILRALNRVIKFYRLNFRKFRKLV